MKAIPPSVEVPGDNAEPKKLLRANGNGMYELRSHIMARTGECLGMTDDEAVWRFGFNPDSEAANAYGVCIPKPQYYPGNPDPVWPGFLWVLATRRTGKIRETFTGFAVELPAHFKRVIDG